MEKILTDLGFSGLIEKFLEQKVIQFLIIDVFVFKSYKLRLQLTRFQQ